MCVSWQWPLWAVWITILPFLILSGAWLGALGTGIGLLVYVVPTLACAVFAGVVATVETKHTYADRPGLRAPSLGRRLARMVPYMVVNAGMLPHHLSAFAEGLFGPLHGEFERTPKAATVTAAVPDPARPTRSRPPPRAVRVAVRAPYLATEAAYFTSQLAWAVLFLADGLLLAALGAGWLAASVGAIGIASYAPTVVAEAKTAAGEVVGAHELDVGERAR